MDPQFSLGLAAIFKALGWVFMPALLLPIAALCLPRIGWIADINTYIIEWIDALNHRIGEFAKWFLLVMIGATIIGVIGLSIFGVSFTKLDELPVYMHASLIMLGSAATLMAGQHVRVDIFHSQYSPQKRALLDLIGFYAFVIPVCILLIWVSQSFVAQSWITYEGSFESDGIRGVYIIKTLIPVFAFLMLLQGLSITARAVKCLQGKALPARPDGIAPLFGQDYISPADSQTLYDSGKDNHDWSAKPGSASDLETGEPS